MVWNSHVAHRKYISKKNSRRVEGDGDGVREGDRMKMYSSLEKFVGGEGDGGGVGEGNRKGNGDGNGDGKGDSDNS